MLATEEILERFRAELDRGYSGEYLNRSEPQLTGGFDYESVALRINPLSKHELGEIEFNGNVTFETRGLSQYGGERSNKSRLNLNLFAAKQSGCNFGSDRVKRKLLPWYSGKFEHSGHYHPFYRDVSDSLEKHMIDNPEMRNKIWWSLLADHRRDFAPVDFGLLVMFIEDERFHILLRYNSFEWCTTLNWNQDLQCLEKTTQNKRITKSACNRK